MAILTLSQAAAAVGISRAAMYRYAANGRISLTETPGGTKGVDASELARVFPMFNPETPSRVSRDSQKDKPAQIETEARLRLEYAEKRIQDLEQQLGEAKDREASTRAEITRVLGILESQTRLLEHKPEPRARARVVVGKLPKAEKKKGKKGKKK